jgi:hypothetical protein
MNVSFHCLQSISGASNLRPEKHLHPACGINGDHLLGSLHVLTFKIKHITMLI